MAYRLIAGLGNPGPRYANTRHNAGFDVLDALAASEGAAPWKDCRFAKARLAELAGGIILLKPQTYMNASGDAIRDALHWYKWPVEELLVVVDDTALPLGRLRLRPQGSCGGHNGLRSIEQALRTDGFARLRIGVGSPETDGPDMVPHVLGRFTPQQQQQFNQTTQKALEILNTCRTSGIETAMNLGNGWTL